MVKKWIMKTEALKKDIESKVETCWNGKYSPYTDYIFLLLTLFLNNSKFWVSNRAVEKSTRYSKVLNMCSLWSINMIATKSIWLVTRRINSEEERRENLNHLFLLRKPAGHVEDRDCLFSSRCALSDVLTVLCKIRVL